jgi:hypothetical protein
LIGEGKTAVFHALLGFFSLGIDITLGVHFAVVSFVLFVEMRTSNHMLSWINFAFKDVRWPVI